MRYLIASNMIYPILDNLSLSFSISYSGVSKDITMGINLLKDRPSSVMDIMEYIVIKIIRTEDVDEDEDNKLITNLTIAVAEHLADHAPGNVNVNNILNNIYHRVESSVRQTPEECSLSEDLGV